MDKRRKHERLILDDPSILHCHGKPCYLIDASKAGLGITYISDGDWPENMILDYILPQGSEKNGSVQCRTAWESRIDFFKLGCWETVRRRGLEFLDPGSKNAVVLYRHSLIKASENRGLKSKLERERG
jgi:hypothetical protein